MRSIASAAWLALVVAVAGCGTRHVVQPQGHIQSEPKAPSASIPQPVRSVPLPPPPKAGNGELRYSVVVADQPVRDVLLAMARETKINFDIHPGIEGRVNLNAIDQTLKQILTRIARQVDVRWESDGTTITVMPDTPFLKNYRVDYVNMARDVTETVGVATQIISGSLTGTTAGAGTGTLGGANNSTVTISASARHRFWETLEKNVKDILRETDKLLPEGSSETFVQSRGQGQMSTTQTRTSANRRGTSSSSITSGTASGQGTTTTGPGSEATAQAQEVVEQRLTFREAASVIVNPETGIVTVRASSRQHDKVAEFLSQITGAARRQVLIEATVVEVLLNDNYQAGVDWSALGINGLGYSFRQNLLGTNLAEAPFFSIQYSNPNAAVGGSLNSTVKLLSSFGKTRVLSSPKLMVLNNQTAVLKVVDNRVYFTIKADTTTNQNTSTTTFTTTANVIPVGFLMNVTAQISDADMITLNVRPTVTRITGFVNDPNPTLRVNSPIPETQTREMESVLRVPSGQTAVLGGLMIDSFVGSRDGLPIASRIPVIGDLVSYRNDTAQRTELVIFIRPVVVRDASLSGDFAEYRRYLPNDEFFRDTRNPVPKLEQKLEQIERGDFGIRPNPVVPDPRPGGESQ